MIHDKKVNHRLKSPALYEKLFDKIDTDLNLLLIIIIKGASKMREKLCSFAQKQLPGGCYWDPDEKTASTQGI